MGTLHEHLAVETQLKGQAQKVRADLTGTFSNKQHLFTKKISSFVPLAEGAETVKEAQSDIQTRVIKELTWAFGHIDKAINVSHQIAEANTVARADIVLDDEAATVIAKGIPATSLLELEKRYAEIKELFSSIPTLDPAKGSIWDSEEKLFRAREVRKNRTQKVKEVLTLAPATDKHPAQVQVYDADKVIGTIVEQEWSAMITPAQKAAIIERAEAVIRAIKKARAKANAQVVDTNARVTNVVTKYLLEPITQD